MTSMIRKPIALAAALVAIGLVGTSARADLIVTVQEDSGPIQTFTTAGSPSSNLTLLQGTVTTADYSIKILGAEANQSASGLFAELTSATTSVTNTTGSSGHVLNITIEGTLYTNPLGAVSVNSQVGGSVTQTSSTNYLTYQSFVNGAGLPQQSPSINTISSYNSDMNGNFSIPTSPFNVGEAISIELNSKGDKVNYSASTSLQSVPEPSSLALAGLGALGMIGYGLRRREARGA